MECRRARKPWTFIRIRRHVAAVRRIPTCLRAWSILGNMDINNRSLRSKSDATERLASEIEDLLRRVDALPTLDSRPEDEILGYGEDGLPR